MSRFHPVPEPSCCPFIDRKDSRCSSQFTLSRLHNAFGLCVNEYQRCTTYHRILSESQVVRTIPMAINGCVRRVGDTGRLRATGT